MSRIRTTEVALLIDDVRNNKSVTLTEDTFVYGFVKDYGCEKYSLSRYGGFFKGYKECDDTIDLRDKHQDSFGIVGQDADELELDTWTVLENLEDFTKLRDGVMYEPKFGSMALLEWIADNCLN